MKKIDLVIPYVNNQDKVWQKTYLDYFQRVNPKLIASLHGQRYEDIGLINYQLKLMEKNMPWVNTIYLLLSNKEQCPKYIPNNCKIVYHYQFIPQKYLPTFNSTTIEMFLWNIPNLEEYFIYANDDMLPVKPLKPSDFFYGNHIKMNFHKEEHTKYDSEFKWQCYNSYKHVFDLAPKHISEIMFNNSENEYLRPYHTITPMIKSHCKECFDQIKDNILPKIRAWRTLEQHNQYIYPIWDYFFYEVYDSKINFFYTHLDEEDFKERMEKAQILCPNVLANKDNIKVLVNYLESLCE